MCLNGTCYLVINLFLCLFFWQWSLVMFGFQFIYLFPAHHKYNASLSNNFFLFSFFAHKIYYMSLKIPSGLYLKMTVIEFQIFCQSSGFWKENLRNVSEKNQARTSIALQITVIQTWITEMTKRQWKILLQANIVIILQRYHNCPTQNT